VAMLLVLGRLGGLSLLPWLLLCLGHGLVLLLGSTRQMMLS
jgi:hypothetical protein